MEFSVSQSQDKADVLLEGTIDESAGAPLTRLRKTLVGSKRVVFDCQGVSNINSTGLRLWVEFLKSLRGALAYEFQRCSVYFVDYANMSPGLVRDAGIHSFFAPFRCPSCNTSHELLLERTQLPENGGFGEHACPKCSTAL